MRPGDGWPLALEARKLAGEGVERLRGRVVPLDGPILQVDALGEHRSMLLSKRASVLKLHAITVKQRRQSSKSLLAMHSPEGGAAAALKSGGAARAAVSIGSARGNRNQDGHVGLRDATGYLLASCSDKRDRPVELRVAIDAKDAGGLAFSLTKHGVYLQEGETGQRKGLSALRCHVHTVHRRSDVPRALRHRDNGRESFRWFHDLAGLNRVEGAVVQVILEISRLYPVPDHLEAEEPQHSSSGHCDCNGVDSADIAENLVGALAEGAAEHRGELLVLVLLLRGAELPLLALQLPLDVQVLFPLSAAVDGDELLGELSDLWFLSGGDELGDVLHDIRALAVRDHACGDALREASDAVREGAVPQVIGPLREFTEVGVNLPRILDLRFLYGEAERGKLRKIRADALKSLDELARRPGACCPQGVPEAVFAERLGEVMPQPRAALDVAEELDKESRCGHGIQLSLPCGRGVEIVRVRVER